MEDIYTIEDVRGAYFLTTIEQLKLIDKSKRSKKFETVHRIKARLPEKSKSQFVYNKENLDRLLEVAGIQKVKDITTGKIYRAKRLLQEYPNV